MRISDWSSDVCSSDLSRQQAAWRRWFHHAVGIERRRPKQMQMPPRARRRHVQQTPILITLLVRFKLADEVIGRAGIVTPRMERRAYELRVTAVALGIAQGRGRVVPDG